MIGRNEHLIYWLEDRLSQLEEEVESAQNTRVPKRDLNPKARYSLREAAAYTGVSPSTLRRREKHGKLAILYDGKRPFVMGAELQRYVREETKRPVGRRRASRRASTRTRR